MKYIRIGIGAIGLMCVIVLLVYPKIFGNYFFPFVIAGLAAIVWGFLANLIYDNTKNVINKWFTPLDKRIGVFLNKLENELRAYVNLEKQLGELNFYQIIYQPNNLTLAAKLAEEIPRRNFDGSAKTFGPISSSEAAMLLLYSTEVPVIKEYLERTFAGHDFHVAIPMFEAASENKSYQYIILTLSFAELLGNSAPEMTDQVISQGQLITTSHWRRISDNLFFKCLEGVSSEALVVSTVIGQINQLSLQVIDTKPTAFDSYHFLLSSPFCVTHSTLRNLAAEYEAPSIFSEPFHFVKYQNDFKIDYLRRVFKILLNSRKIVDFAKKYPDKNVKVSFYKSKYPGMSFRILTKSGIILIHTGALDVAKYISRFAAYLQSHALVDKLINSINRELETEQGKIESWIPNDEHLGNIEEQSLRELVTFLLGNGISKDDVKKNEDRIRVALRVSGKAVDDLFHKLRKIYDWQTTVHVS